MARDSKVVSKNMSKIHSKDTSIELQLRKTLWHKGYRYRKNYKELPGSPDIALTKYKIA
ncbi:MAG TPA: very short patch repair endonuclease, partial [Lachnospiraceae bacterium]|nr:very short patch repair endonuclease [Lachnospiraceae bacterium]